MNHKMLKAEDSRRASEKSDPYCAHSHVTVTVVVIRTSKSEVEQV
jgi:hypothetical protein